MSWIIVISTIVTAAATVVLAKITWEYVRLTQDILKATNKPKVILFLRYSHSSISLCVQNIGTGYASDVEFGGDLSFKTTNPYPEEGKVLKDIEPFKSGINFLGTGHKIDTDLCHTGDVRDLEKRSFKILVSYKDSANKPFKQLFSFDLGNWEDTSQYISPHTDDVANAIENVATNIETLSHARSGTESLQHIGQSIFSQDDPRTKALERIADALERMSSSDSKNS